MSASLKGKFVYLLTLQLPGEVSNFVFQSLAEAHSAGKAFCAVNPGGVATVRTCKVKWAAPEAEGLFA